MSERHDVTHHTAGFTPRRARLKQPHLHVKPSTMAPSTSDTKTSAAIGCCGSAPGVWHSRTRRKRVRVILGHVVAAPRATEADRAGLPGPGSARRPPRRDQGEPRDLQPDLAGGHRSESAHPHPAIRSMPLRLSCEKIHRRAPPTEVAEVHRERRDVKNVSNRGGRERLAGVKKIHRPGAVFNRVSGRGCRAGVGRRCRVARLSASLAAASTPPASLASSAERRWRTNPSFPTTR